MKRVLHEGAKVVKNNYMCIGSANMWCVTLKTALGALQVRCTAHVLAHSSRLQPSHVENPIIPSIKPLLFLPQQLKNKSTKSIDPHLVIIYSLKLTELKYILITK